MKKENIGLAVLSRLLTGRGFNPSYSGDRDYYEVLGYPEKLTIDDYLVAYERGDIAPRIIEAACLDTWRGSVELVPVTKSETTKEDFQNEWKRLCDKKKLIRFLKKVDIVSGIGQYGVLFFGLREKGKRVKGAKALSSPVTKGSVSDIMYIKAFHEKRVKIDTIQINPTNPRFGLPEMYSIQLIPNGQWIKVHHTRCLHVADNTTNDEIYGTPRLERVFNKLEDMKKVAGGGAEMFWRGAFPGIAFEADADSEMTENDEKKMNNEIEEYIHNFKRYLRLQGIKAKSLSVSVGDPSGHFKILIQLIAGATGIPARILMGSEAGQMASTQDENNWISKVNERRMSYASPDILLPCIEKFTFYGLLPIVDEVTTVWPDMRADDDKAKAVVGETTTRALVMYSRTPEAMEIIPPEQFLEHVMRLDPKKIQEIKKNWNFLFDYIGGEERDSLDDGDGLMQSRIGTDE